MPVNGFGLACFIDIARCVAKTSYSDLWDGLRASYCYSSGVVGISRCIMAASCIHTLLGANFLIKMNK